NDAAGLESLSYESAQGAEVRNRLRTIAPFEPAPDRPPTISPHPSGDGNNDFYVVEGCVLGAASIAEAGPFINGPSTPGGPAPGDPPGRFIYCTQWQVTRPSLTYRVLDGPNQGQTGTMMLEAPGYNPGGGDLLQWPTAGNLALTFTDFTPDL